MPERTDVDEHKFPTVSRIQPKPLEIFTPSVLVVNTIQWMLSTGESRQAAVGIFCCIPDLKSADLHMGYGIGGVNNQPQTGSTHTRAVRNFNVQI